MKASADFNTYAERGEKARLLIISNNNPSFNLPSVSNTQYPSKENVVLEKTGRPDKQKTTKPKPRKK